MVLSASTSSDAVLRCYAPPVLSTLYSISRAKFGDSRDELGRWIGFADATQRFLFACLASEYGRLGLQPEEGSEYSKLLKSLHKPSMGHWSKALGELSKTLASLPADELVAARLVHLIYAPRTQGKPKRTQLGEAFQTITETRNEIVHADGTLIPDPIESAKLLEQLESPFRTLVKSLRVLRHFRVCSREHVVHEFGLEPSAALLLFAGRDPRTIPVSLVDLEMQPQVPYLLNAEGQGLLLSPYMMVDHFHHSPLPTLRILSKIGDKNGIPEYSDPMGRTPGPSPSRYKHEIFGSCIQWPEFLIKRQTTRCELRKPSLERLQMSSEAAPQVLVDRYRIIGRLGAGGSGAVYSAQELGDNGQVVRDVAIKVLHANVVNDEIQRQRLQAEYEAMGRITHPAVVTVFELLEDDKWGPFIVMELVDGTDLETVLGTGELSIREVFLLGESLLRALAAAHSEEVIHRDIKPSNVLMDTESRARLVDFGIATGAFLPRLTVTYDAVGTLDYAAPEQIAGDQVGVTADIYSVGRVLARCVSTKNDDEVPRALSAIIRRASQKQAVNRFESAVEMLSAIRVAATGGKDLPPVLEGDRLNDSHDVGSLVEASGAVWGFDGVEVTTEKHIGLLVSGPDNNSRRKFERAASKLTNSQKASVGPWGTMQTGDGLLYVTVDSGRIRHAIRLISRGGAHDATDELDWPKKSFHSKSMLGISEISQGKYGWIQAAKTTLRLLALSVALERCKVVDDLIPYWLSELRGGEGSSLFAGERGRGFRAQDGIPIEDSAALADELMGKAQVVRDFIHGSGNVSVAPKGLDTTIEQLSAAIQLEKIDRSVEYWFPVVALGPSGIEILNAEAGHLGYVLLKNSSSGTQEMTSTILKTLAGYPEGLRFKNRGLRIAAKAARSDLMTSVRRSVIAKNQVKKVVEGHRVRIGKRSVVVDVVGLGHEDIPILAVQLVRHVTGITDRMGRGSDELWMIAKALDVPVVAQTNGRVWHWFVVSDLAMTRVKGASQAQEAIRRKLLGETVLADDSRLVEAGRLQAEVGALEQTLDSLMRQNQVEVPGHSLRPLWMQFTKAIARVPKETKELMSEIIASRNSIVHGESNLSSVEIGTLRRHVSRISEYVQGEGQTIDLLPALQSKYGTLIRGDLEEVRVLRRLEGAVIATTRFRASGNETRHVQYADVFGQAPFRFEQELSPTENAERLIEGLEPDRLLSNRLQLVGRSGRVLSVLEALESARDAGTKRCLVMGPPDRGTSWILALDICATSRRLGRKLTVVVIDEGNVATNDAMLLTGDCTQTILIRSAEKLGSLPTPKPNRIDYVVVAYVESVETLNSIDDYVSNANPEFVLGLQRSGTAKDFRESAFNWGSVFRDSAVDGKHLMELSERDGIDIYVEERPTLEDLAPEGMGPDDIDWDS